MSAHAGQAAVTEIASAGAVRGGRRRMDLERCAEVARRRLHGGERPGTLAAAFSISQPTVAAWVRAAVDAGLVQVPASRPRRGRPGARLSHPARCMHCGEWSWNLDPGADAPAGFCSVEHLLLGRLARGSVGAAALFVCIDGRCGKCGGDFTVLRLRTGPAPARCASCDVAERNRKAALRAPRVERDARRCALARCGRSFMGVGLQRYCSGACRREARLGPPVMAGRHCLGCGKDFEVELSRSGKARSGWFGYKRGPFCSRECAIAFHERAAARAVVEVRCARCGKPFEVVRKGHKRVAVYCSVECKNHALDEREGLVDLFERTCASCSRVFLAAQRAGDGPLRFCSEECRLGAGDTSLSGRHRVVSAGCERCARGFVYVHGYDTFRRFCSARCQRRAGAERVWARRRQRKAPCLVCGEDTRRGRAGTPALWCSDECRAVLDARRRKRECARCGGGFLAEDAESTAKLCPGCRGARRGGVARATVGGGAGRMVVRRSVARAADLTQECVIHLAVAGRLAEEGSEGRVERELACAERALSEAAEALASVAGVASPVGRARRVTGGSAGLRSVEDQVEAVARGLAALVVAVRRGAGSGRVREVAVAVGELRGQVAASRALWVRRTAA